ncbi:hypothetical protein HYC85_021294 [Camellia sinensis]|uniref:Peptidase M10 metallopeptidase domain-containing protein n=1 Tax=Camellia sinensis TaxID=4442 RepID=A0A7J7GI37_CAMSI|nr:hypothetical protein HYC85_021294 [Camellia sinensis]
MSSTQALASSILWLAITSFWDGPRWPASKTHLTYAFLSRADVLGLPYAQAFENWDSVTHFTLEEIQNYDVADVKISFQIGDHGDRAGAFDGPHGVLAHSFAPDDRRVHFDGQDLWSMIRSRTFSFCLCKPSSLFLKHSLP